MTGSGDVGFRVFEFRGLESMLQGLDFEERLGGAQGFRFRLYFNVILTWL